jgi:phosphatidylserine decarboxylase
MRKSEDQITEADKQDAKRRIQGGQSDSPEDSGGDEVPVDLRVPDTASAGADA